VLNLVTDVSAHRSIAGVAETDIVIVPSMQMHDDGDWTPARYPRIITWLRAMHAGGATICRPARAAW
jgi:hypothetical protein